MSTPPKPAAPSTMTTADPADEAGGEAVYSSDGLAPLPVIPRPPPSSASAVLNQLRRDEGDHDVLDSASLDPREAFEVFSGRIIFPDRSTSYQKSMGGPKEEESPLIRFARLRAEVSELENELSSSSMTMGGDTTNQDEHGAAVEELNQLAQTLSQRLNAMGNKHGFLPGNDEGAGGPEGLYKWRQEDLTALIRRELETLKQTEKEEVATTKQQDSEVKTTSAGKSEGSVVYELYKPVTSSSSPSSSSGSTIAQIGLEERLLNIEKLIGASQVVSGGASKRGEGSNSNSSNMTILQRLEEAEKICRVLLVDEKKHNQYLESAAARARVIRADLEAAAKAKSKLNISTTTSEDSKVISSLHDQMMDLENMSTHLPTIIMRLQQLSSLHTQAATFSTRLVAVENAATETERLLSGVEETLERMEKGFRTNIEVVERNTDKLDERMNRLFSTE